jgi:hypothetical protein
MLDREANGNHESDGEDTGGTGFLYAHIGDYTEAAKLYAKALDDRSFHFGFDLGASIPAAFFASPEWQAVAKRPDYTAWAAARQRAIATLVDSK